MLSQHLLNGVSALSKWETAQQHILASIFLQQQQQQQQRGAGAGSLAKSDKPGAAEPVACS
jgi:hypothetical protein